MPLDIQPGAIVRHDRYGAGIVTAVEHLPLRGMAPRIHCEFEWAWGDRRGESGKRKRACHPGDLTVVAVNAPPSAHAMPTA